MARMPDVTAYHLRPFYPDDPEEIERMNLMFYHPHVLKHMGFKEGEHYPERRDELQRPDKSMFASASEVREKHGDVAYGIADAADGLVGWVWFCIDKRHPLPVRVARRLEVLPQTRVYQVVYEKLLSADWPDYLIERMVHVKHEELFRTRKGVVVEGLRLAILKLKHEYGRLWTKPAELVLYGFVLPENIASQKVLLANGFSREDRLYWCDGVEHQLWVSVI